MRAPRSLTALSARILLTGFVVIAVMFGASPGGWVSGEDKSSPPVGTVAPAGPSASLVGIASRPPCGSLQDRIDATAPGASLDLSGCSYQLSTAVRVGQPIHIIGGSVAATTGAFEITSSQVTLAGMTIRGPGFAKDNEHYGISVVGDSASSPVRDITITGNTITDWDGDGIFAQFVDGFLFEDNQIENIWYAGIECFSVANGVIAGNRVANVVGTGNAYGITLSRGYGGGLEDNPRSARVEVRNNTVEDIPHWEGLDTHGGQEIVFADNVIRRVLYPIVVRGAADESGGRALFAPLEVSIRGNDIDSEVDDGSMAGQAINFIGANAGSGLLGSSTELATGSIEANLIRGYGLQSNGEYSAIKVSDTSGLRIVDNTIIEPSPTGIQVYLNNYDFVVAANTIQDAWSSDLGRALGIFVQSDYNVGVIEGNRFVRGGKSASSVLTRNVVVVDLPHNRVSVR